MDLLSAEKEVIALEKKLLKDEQRTFIDEVRAMPETALKDTILRLNKGLQDNITAKQNDEELKNAQNHVSNLKAPYDTFKKKNAQKVRFVSLLLKEKYEE